MCLFVQSLNQVVLFSRSANRKIAQRLFPGAITESLPPSSRHANKTMALVRLRSCTLLRRSLAPASSTSSSSSSSSSSALFSSSTAVAADAAPSDSSAPLPAPVPVLRTIKHLRYARPWGEKSKRVGLLGIKCGMTRGWDAFGKHLPLTVIKIDHCFVTQVKPEVSPSGFIGIQVGASLINPKNVAKPQRLHLEKANLPPLRQMVEFQVTPDAIVHAGTKLDLRHFAVGQYIDVRGISCVFILDSCIRSFVHSFPRPTTAALIHGQTFLKNAAHFF